MKRSEVAALLSMCSAYEQIPSRLWERIEVNEDTGCWLWIGSCYRNGYSQIWNGSRPSLGHRFVYECVVGKIPAASEIDHLCRVRNCLRPEHLQAVSHRENVLRSFAPTAVNAAKTHCPKGHPYTPENTYRRPADGKRRCRECGRRQCRAYRNKVAKK